jgi:hypothetical protein
VHLLHKFERGWPDRDNHVWFAILIFANVELAKLLLDGRIGEQRGIKVLGIKLKVIRCAIQRGLDSLTDNGDCGIGSADFVQNQNASGFLRLWRCNRM